MDIYWYSKDNHNIYIDTWPIRQIYYIYIYINYIFF